jgi:hypothetical protein
VTQDQAVLLAACALAVACALGCVVLLIVVMRLRSHGRRADDELASLHRRLDDLEQRDRLATVSEPVPAPVEFVITDLGQARPAPEPVHPDGPAFADIVLRETVVKAASLAHGVRRGLAPATRNRIRFEMRQEVRRSRRQRRADLKAARRDLHARQRSTLTEEAS